MSEMESSDDDALAPGTLVSIDGLQSDAGKALNGASGIILGPPSNDNGVRYPVLLYAVVFEQDDSGKPKEALLNPPIKRKIKDVNLTEKSNQKCKLYEKACLEQAQKTVSGVPDYKAAVFWLAGYYERWPEDLRTTITYANLLRGICKEPKEAWKILRKAVPLVEPTEPKINECRYDACITCCAAEGDAEEALEWALKIETDTDDRKQLAMEALEAVRSYSRGNFKRMVDMDSGDGPLLEVHLRTAQAMYELKPERAKCLASLGNAHCMLGNNKEGVRWYRRALASGNFQGEALEELKRDLGLAMMQCPGGAMAEYRVLGVTDDGYHCLHKASIGQYNVYAAGTGDGSMGGIIRNTGPEPLELVTFPFADIDDDEFFANVDLPPQED